MKTQGSYAEPVTKTLRDIVDARSTLKFNPEDPLPDVVERMRARNQKTGGVVDAGGRLVGLITESSIARRVFPRLSLWPEDLSHLPRHKGAEEMIAWDVMIPDPDALRADDALEDALETMNSFGHRYMPVVETDGRLVGIISERELFWRTQEGLSRTIRGQEELISYFIREPYGCGSAAERTMN